MSAESCLSRTWEKGTKTRSPVQTKTSEITEHLQQIQEVVSGHLHEITKELMDLDPSNSTTISKEQFRQLCDHHCLRLTNDQVMFTSPSKLVHYNSENSKRRHSREQAHFQQLSQCFQAETAHTGIISCLQMRNWIWILVHLPVPFFLVWYVFFNYSNQNRIYLFW